MRIFGLEISKAKKAARPVSMGGKYRVVTFPDNLNRELGMRETGDEADILNDEKRAQLLDMARNLQRNSSTFNAIIKQFELNVVGSQGGKAAFLLDDEAASDAMREKFSSWARSCEFHDGMRLADLLKLILKTYLIGGECVLLFDDNLIEDSGRVLIYEPDEIANLKPAQFSRIFPAGWTQVGGHIRNEHRRAVGVIVTNERGVDEVDESNCYKLTKNPDASDEDILWINPRNVWRKGQTIGVTPCAPLVSTVEDLERVVDYELQAAKKNSQTVMQLLQSDEGAEEPMPSAFGSDTDFSSMTDEQIRAAADSEAAVERVCSLDPVRGSGAITQVLEKGMKLEMLDTKHPNQNMPDFINWLAGRSAAPWGLPSMYATLKVDQSFSGCQGEMNMAWPAFEDMQKFLERICDWILVRWSVWAARKGVISTSDADGLARKVNWYWPRMRAVNAVDEQTAIEKRLSNCTGSYRDIYGADWKAKVLEIAEEIKFFREHDIPHPALVTVSGAVVNMEGEGGMEVR